MLQIQIFNIGKIKQDFVLAGEAEYHKRLARNVKLEFHELSASSANSANEAEVKAKEAELFLKKISAKDYLIVLDEKGKTLTSQEFAHFFQSKMNQGISKFIFAIGGAYGWDKTVQQRANFLLSLSAMTFTYQMSRLILVEQIYRAHTINAGLPYSK